MAIRDLFGKRSNKVLPATTVQEAGQEVESVELIKQTIEDKERFVPDVDYTAPANFARFGSAKQYYVDAINDILTKYPYDGSAAEKLEFRNGASDLENYLFDNEYPRYTGYITLGLNYGSVGAPSNGYQTPTTQEYILFKGGPHTLDNATTVSLSALFDGANVYDVTSSRESNLEINGEDGNTVEFFLYKNSVSGSAKEVICDFWNSGSFGTDAYGRFRVELRPGVAGAGNKFFIEYMSGSAGIYETSIGNNLTITGSAWSQYSIAIQNSGSNLSIKLYENGDLNQSILTGSTVGLVTGSMVGTVGALVTSVSGAYGALGAGKLSASLDEFRFWKTKRTDKQIGRHWFTHINGGANTDDANVELGVYYKFNEGIVNTGSISSLDSKVLDYSGRITNGTWYGYAVGARNTGSAIVSSSAAASEYRDPVVYSTHPEVVSLLADKERVGDNHDRTNNASLYNAFPDWILDEDNEKNGLFNLVQIMAAFFDDLYLKIEALPNIRDASYKNGKPAPFAGRLLETMGFVAPEIFSDATVLEAIAARNENENFEEKLHNVKNYIYQNIYNNLIYIYRSKGTEKSIRNLLRCFGVDDELIKLNMYADGVDYKFEDRYRYTTFRKKYVDFNDSDRFDSTVYQMSQSGNPNSTSFISGNINLGYLGTTFEAEAIFPKKFDISNPLYFRTDFVSSSLFGMHEADPSNPNKTTWFGSDRAEFSVYAVRPEEESKDVRFKLTSSYLGIELTSDLYPEVYNNEKWNFAVRIRHEKWPLADSITGTSTGGYIVEFYGANAHLDYIQNEFLLTASISQTLGEGHMSAAKRIYVGAHRQNFTGSLIVGPGPNGDEFSDAKISGIRYWLTNIPDNIIKEHAKDPSNFGPESVYLNIEPFLANVLDVNNTYQIQIPQTETLALHWDFETVTGSDGGSGLPPSNTSDGMFVVEDVSSGSVALQSRYGVLGPILKAQHTGRGDYFLRNNTEVIQREYVQAARRRLPEVLTDDDMVQIINTEDDLQFTRDSVPINHWFAMEKSMYQTISEDIIRYFGTIADFNNVIGQPVDRYRMEYQNLDKLRYLFFEKIENTPDLDTYVEFYKWIDNAVTQMVLQLIPASANFDQEIANVIESHVLERNKYWSKLPTLEFKHNIPEGGTKGINELKYPWKQGHAPISGLQSDNCYWWQQKAERTDNNLNSDRTQILAVSLSALNRKFTTVYDFGVDAVTITNDKVKTSDVVRAVNAFGSGGYLLIEVGDLPQKPDCDD